MSKYPQVTVALVGQNGNALMVLGLTIRAMKKAGLPQSEVKAYQEEATKGDYDHLLRTTMEWVNVE